MSGSSIYVQRADCRRHDTPIALVVIEADQLTPDERTALALLTSRVPTAPLSSPKQGDLARLCQEHGCALDRTAVIATTPQGLPLLLEASVSLTLRGAGYENEAAADMVFKPRSSGGLAAAIEYACRLVA
ncbi:hypothetical protein DXD49_09125 [Collinsella sp. TM05-38]|jgi:hypothetical protein|uniref:hypothetical protein n=1 Tax=unclassified Collinsella TaxID=2637548 RepID=UPI000E4F6390|nr:MULTISPECIES: hypothetical protein [unclassified Collinsella]RGJ67234.1 hypothetical protein DXD49_09125 [Collinsella sp. TM05-38]RHL23287.1 hypothetical protein DW029_07225 [Collinsella sp. AF38-3AC]